MIKHSVIKSTMKLSLMALLMAWFGAKGQSSSPLDQEVIDIHRKYEKAVEEKDSFFVKKLFDDRMTITGGDGTRRNKEQEIADLTNLQYDVHYFKTENIEVKIYDKNVAILLGDLKWEHTYRGNRSTTERRITFIYLKTKNEWKIISQNIHRKPLK